MYRSRLPEFSLNLLSLPSQGSPLLRAREPCCGRCAVAMSSWLLHSAEPVVCWPAAGGGTTQRAGDRTGGFGMSSLTSEPFSVRTC